jgi:hypothetical protein
VAGHLPVTRYSMAAHTAPAEFMEVAGV